MIIPIVKSVSPRLNIEKIASHQLTNVHSDHMFVAEYTGGSWHSARIQPFGAISLSPLALGLHYAQIVFEGMKAYRMDDGKVGVFRTDRHHERFNTSLRRMCMPEVSSDMFTSAVHSLVEVDKGWVPPDDDAAYYIRPFMIASEERMGLKIADEFMFMVIGGPFRPIYNHRLRVKIEQEYTRASQGGTGYAKCAGNYASAMLPTRRAQEDGFDQVIWTDAREHQFVEESGTMNLCFVIDGVVVTPPVGDTILDGVTRHSVLEIARDLGVSVEERAVRTNELVSGIDSGRITEAFGVGTAASIAPIGVVSLNGKDHTMEEQEDSVAMRIKKRLVDIRFGRANDARRWMNIIGLFLVMLLSSCGGVPVLIEATWMVEAVGDTTLKYAENDVRRPQFRFLPKGRVMGYSGCNPIIGTWVQDDYNVSFIDLESPAENCPHKPLEDAIVSALKRTTHAKRSDNILTLWTGDTLLMTCSEFLMPEGGLPAMP